MFKIWNKYRALNNFLIMGDNYNYVTYIDLIRPSHLFVLFKGNF